MKPPLALVGVVLLCGCCVSNYGGGPQCYNLVGHGWFGQDLWEQTPCVTEPVPDVPTRPIDLPPPGFEGPDTTEYE